MALNATLTAKISTKQIGDRTPWREDDSRHRPLAVPLGPIGHARVPNGALRALLPCRTKHADRLPHYQGHPVILCRGARAAAGGVEAEAAATKTPRTSQTGGSIWLGELKSLGGFSGAI